MRGQSAKDKKINSTAKSAHKTSSQVIDGFVKAPSRNRQSKTPAHQLHSRTDKAHTLMRGALKKPAGHFNSKIQNLNPGHNPEREVRAKTASKHGRIEHFGNPQKPQETQHEVLQGEVIPSHSHQTANSHPVPSAPVAVALPSMITSASHQKLERMLDAALTNADAHKQAMRYQAARHFWQRPGFLGRRAGLKVILICLVVLAAGLFLAWEKLPQVSVKLAGVRTHVNAAVPNYKPAGFDLASPASAAGGSVVTNYKNTDTSQNYSLIQKHSNMTTASMAQAVVPAGSQVQTSQIDGNTVYIYGSENSAAWVNNGIFYSLKDHANLSSDEIIKIVQGLN